MQAPKPQVVESTNEVATTNDMAVGVGQEIVPSLPMHIHFGHAARLDITPALPISTAGIYEPGFHDGTIAGHAFGGGNGGTTAGLDVPLNLAVQIVEQLHFDIGTGFNMTFNPVASAPGSTFGDFFALPFGFDLGIAVPGPRGPIFEMTPFFLWPALLVPGVQNGIDGVQSAFWETGINFRGYIYM